MSSRSHRVTGSSGHRVDSDDWTALPVIEGGREGASSGHRVDSTTRWLRLDVASMARSLDPDSDRHGLTDTECAGRHGHCAGRFRYRRRAGRRCPSVTADPPSGPRAAEGPANHALKPTRTVGQRMCADRASARAGADARARAVYRAHMRLPPVVQSAGPPGLKFVGW